MFDSSMKPPFGLVVRDDMPFFGIYDTLLPEELISEDLINEHYSGERVYAAFDISRVNDATGFSAIFYSEEERKILPLVVVPIYLNRNVAGNEIDQVKLVGLVLALYRMGVNFRYITADGFSSDFLIQRFKLIFGNEFAGRFSVDKNKAAHITMLNFMKLGMYRLYPVPRLAYELEHLVDDPVAGMVDHPPNTDPSNPVYFKDVSDSLAAASFHLSVYEELSYEDLMVSGEVAKARSQRAVAEDGEEDFYSDIDEGGEDFYSDLSVYEDELPVDPLTKLERDIRP
jgi:hypothetical protein